MRNAQHNSDPGINQYANELVNPPGGLTWSRSNMIQKSRRHFSAWLGLMVVCVAGTSGYDLDERRTNLYKQLSGTKGTGNLLYEVQVRSTIHCAALCLGCPECDGCGFDESNNKCRFFRGRSSQVDPGSTFMYKLLGKFAFSVHLLIFFLFCLFNCRPSIRMEISIKNKHITQYKILNSTFYQHLDGRTDGRIWVRMLVFPWWFL